MILENAFLSLFQNIKHASIWNNSNSDSSPGNQLIHAKELIILTDSTQISAELLCSFLRETYEKGQWFDGTWTWWWITATVLMK